MSTTWWNSGRWRHDSLLYEVTARCNLACSHCYNVWKSVSGDCGNPVATNCEPGTRRPELDTAGAVQLIRKAIRDSHCRHFSFTGGEPLLRDDLEVLVKTAREHCRHINLITNGTRLPKTRIRSLLDAGVSLFELPLNSARPEVHDRMAGAAGCFDQVTRAIVDIVASGGAIALVFVATAENIRDWRGVLDLGMALGARTFLFNRYNAGGACVDPAALMPTVEQVREGLMSAQEYASKYGVGISASIPIMPCLVDLDAFPSVGFGFCAAGTSRAYYTLDPHGNVRPCNHSPTILGNLMNATLRELAESAAMTDFRKARPEFCHDCRRVDECAGGCKAAAQVCTGSLTGRDPFLDANRRAVRRLHTV